MTAREYLAAGVLTERECEVVELRFGSRPLSQYQASLALGISRTRVRELERRALQKIHEHNRKEAA